MEELMNAIIAIHRGYTMTRSDWAQEWTSHISISENRPP